MTKYLLKFIKYILTTSKNWTGVGLLSYRDVYLQILHSTSIRRKNILSRISTKITDTTTRLTKDPPAMRNSGVFVKID